MTGTLQKHFHCLMSPSYCLGWYDGRRRQTLHRRNMQLFHLQFCRLQTIVLRLAGANAGRNKIFNPQPETGAFQNEDEYFFHYSILSLKG